MADEYLLDDKAWAAIEPLLPEVYAGARRKDDRRIISGIVHVLPAASAMISSQVKPPIFHQGLSTYSTLSSSGGMACFSHRRHHCSCSSLSSGYGLS